MHGRVHFSSHGLCSSSEWKAYSFSFGKDIFKDGGPGHVLKTPERRGLAFGALYVTSGIGAMAGSLYATNIGETRPLLRLLQVNNSTAH